jgi:hypothetical protein
MTWNVNRPWWFSGLVDDGCDLRLFRVTWLGCSLLVDFKTKWCRAMVFRYPEHVIECDQVIVSKWVLELKRAISTFQTANGVKNALEDYSPREIKLLGPSFLR